MSRTVRLIATARRFVASEDELEQGGQERALVVPASVRTKVVGLAQTKGFRSRGRHFHPAEAAAFAKCVRDGLEHQPVISPGRRVSAVKPADQLKEFFDDPANRKMLQRIVALAELGSGLDVVEL